MVDKEKIEGDYQFGNILTNFRIL